MNSVTESVVEDAILPWPETAGDAVLCSLDIVAGEPAAECSDPKYREVVLEGRLRQALASFNPNLPSRALEDPCRKLTRTGAPSLLERNRAAHRMLVDGVTVEHRRKDGSVMAVVPLGQTPADIHSRLQNVMHPYLETAA